MLARVKKDKLRDRDAWEFFERLDEHGVPVWTTYINRCSKVFRYPRHCERVDAVYDPVLKRYLLVLGYNHEGGWGIFQRPSHGDPGSPHTTPRSGTSHTLTVTACPRNGSRKMGAG